MSNAIYSEQAGVGRKTLAIETGGAATESMGGLALIVLAILALVGVMRGVLTDVAGIIFGAAFIVEGAALAARHTAIMDQAARGRLDAFELGGGMTVEIVAGVAAIALGILSLVGLAPTVLMPALVITGGAGLILSAGTVSRMNDIRATAFEIDDATRSIARTAVSGAAGGQILTGLGAITLGILALVGVGDPAILTTVGLLVLGAALTFSGTALSGWMLSLFRRA